MSCSPSKMLMISYNLLLSIPSSFVSSSKLMVWFSLVHSPARNLRLSSERLFSPRQYGTGDLQSVVFGLSVLITLKIPSRGTPNSSLYPNDSIGHQSFFCLENLNCFPDFYSLLSPAVSFEIRSEERRVGKECR